MNKFVLVALGAFLLAAPALAQTVPGSPSLATKQVSVGTSATLIVAAHPGRANLVIVNDGSVNVFVGNSGVTSSTGLLIPPSTTVPIPVTLNYQGALYGVAASSETVSVGELF